MNLFVKQFLYQSTGMLANVLNRGGLWKVNEDLIVIFSVAEAYFLSPTKKLQNKIVSKDIVNALMENCMVLESFVKLT